MNRTALYRPAPDILVASLADGAALFDKSSGVYFGLDEVGQRFWELLDGRRAMSDICAALAKEYDAPEGTIACDLEELAQDMLIHGLIKPTAHETR